MLKKMVSAFMVCVLALSITACSPSSERTPSVGTNSGEMSAANLNLNPITLSIGTSASNGSTQVYLCEEFARLASEYSDGAITIDIFPNGQLGGDKDIVELVSDNAVTFYVGNAYSVNYIVPVCDVFTIPCVGNSSMDINDTISGLNGDFLDLLNNYATQQGFLALGICAGNSFRNITSNREYTGLESLKGLDLRVTEQDTFIKFWGELGINTTPLPINELYIALQQGLVEAQENALERVVTNNFQEVQKYCILTQHLEDHPILVSNEETFNNLDPAYQDILKNAASDAVRAASEQMQEYEDEYRQQLEDEGMIFYEVSVEDRAKLEELAVDCIDIVIDYGVADKVVDAYLAIYGMSR